MPLDRRRFVQGSLMTIAAQPLSHALAAEGEAPPRRLRILILGGTGFIGPHQVRHALARGHEVTLFNRGREPRAWPGRVEELIGDRNTGDLQALEGGRWDVCIDNPTTLPFWVRDAGRALHGRVGQYIFISTVSVYASNEKAEDESAPVARYTGQDPMSETAATLRGRVAELYGPLKAVSEQEAERQFPGAVTIVRPGLIVGPGDETDRFTYWPVRLARGGEVLAPGDGSDPVQFIDARDLAEWTVHLAESGTLGVFNATGPERPLAMSGMLAGIATAIHAGARLTWVPTAFLEAHHVSPWSDLPVWVPGQGDSAGFARRDIRRALRAGLAFRPLAATAADTLAWFQARSPERQGKLRAGLSPEREAQLLADWKASSKSGR